MLLEEIVLCGVSTDDKVFHGAAHTKIVPLSKLKTDDNRV